MKQRSEKASNKEGLAAQVPFDDALRKILSAPPAPKVKPKPKAKEKKETGS